MNKADNRADVAQRFARDTAAHEMTVLLDQGIYRHLRFRKPGTGCYGFDIVTWPGYLAISGDMGAAMFTRLNDMFEFFRGEPSNWAEKHPGQLYINSGYWAEKCCANDGEKKEFVDALFAQLVRDEAAEFIENHTDDDGEPAWAGDLREAIESDLVIPADLDTSHALNLMEDFEHDDSGFRFTDVFEYTNQVEDYTFHFLWRLYAIAHAVKAYDAQHPVAQQPPAQQVAA